VVLPSPAALERQEGQFTHEAMGDDVYQLDGSEAQDHAGPLDSVDTLDYSAGEDSLDEGNSPSEHPWAVQHDGVTATERVRGKSLDERLTEEVPDISDVAGDGLGISGTRTTN
jgi:hypothetical protein